MTSALVSSGRSSRYEYNLSDPQCSTCQFPKIQQLARYMGPNGQGRGRPWQSEETKGRNLRSLSGPQKAAAWNSIPNLIIVPSPIGDTDRGIVEAPGTTGSSDHQKASSPGRGGIKYREGSFFCSENLARRWLLVSGLNKNN